MSEKIVMLPFAGHLEVYVDAEDDEDAIAKAYEKELGIKLQSENENEVYIAVYDIYEKIVEGNICYVYQKEIEVVDA